MLTPTYDIEYDSDVVGGDNSMKRHVRPESCLPNSETEVAMDRLWSNEMTLWRLHLAHPRAVIHEYFPLKPPYPTAAIAYLIAQLENKVLKMAGKSKGNVSQWVKPVFVNMTLNEEQKKIFTTWYKSEGERLSDFLGQVMVDDYKVSVNWDDNNQCFIASFTGKEDQRFNSNMVLSSRSDDWYEAIGLNLYKHLILCKSGKWDGETTKNNWG